MEVKHMTNPICYDCHIGASGAISMEIIRISEVHIRVVNCEVADIHTSVRARYIFHREASTLETFVSHFKKLSLMRIHCVELSVKILLGIS